MSDIEFTWDQKKGNNRARDPRKLEKKKNVNYISYDRDADIDQFSVQDAGSSWKT